MTLRPLALSSLALALLAATPAAAQQPLPTMPVNLAATTVQVSAEAHVERTPDVADMSTGVVTNAPTAAEALRQNAERMTTVIAALRRAGIAERDIQTSGINLQPQYMYRENQPPQLTGYQAINNVNVRVRKLAELGKIIDTLIAQGSNQINGPSFRLDKPEPALDEARTKAVATARERAQLYASAIGMRVKRIVSISEGFAAPPPYPMPMARMAAMDAAEKASTPVAPGEVQLTANVNVIFELE